MYQKIFWFYAFFIHFERLCMSGPCHGFQSVLFLMRFIWIYFWLPPHLSTICTRRNQFIFFYIYSDVCFKLKHCFGVSFCKLWTIIWIRRLFEDIYMCVCKLVKLPPPFSLSLSPLPPPPPSETSILWKYFFLSIFSWPS